MMTVSITAFSIMTLSITIKNATLSIIALYTVMLGVIVLSVIYAECRKYANYAEYCYAECQKVECHGTLKIVVLPLSYLSTLLNHALKLHYTLGYYMNVNITILKSFTI